MIWGEICCNGHTELHICHSTMTGPIYARDIVNGILPNFQSTIGENIFIDDNGRPHC